MSVGTLQYAGLEIIADIRYDKGDYETPPSTYTDVLEFTIKEPKELVRELLEQSFRNDPAALVDFINEQFTKQGGT